MKEKIPALTMRFCKCGRNMPVRNGKMDAHLTDGRGNPCPVAAKAAKRTE